MSCVPCKQSGLARWCWICHQWALPRLVLYQVWRFSSYNCLLPMSLLCFLKDFWWLCVLISSSGNLMKSSREFSFVTFTMSSWFPFEFSWGSGLVVVETGNSTLFSCGAGAAWQPGGSGGPGQGQFLEPSQVLETFQVCTRHGQGSETDPLIGQL